MQCKLRRVSGAKAGKKYVWEWSFNILILKSWIFTRNTQAFLKGYDIKLEVIRLQFLTFSQTCKTSFLKHSDLNLWIFFSNHGPVPCENK